MLYQFYEFQHSVWSPFRHAAEKMEEVFRSPFMPVSYTPMGRAIAASCHLFERVTRRYIKPEFGLHTTEIDGNEVAVDEEVVLHKPFCELLHFKRHTKQEHPKLLVVAPLSGHYATLLRGTVEALLPDHDVYITDWINARDVCTSHGTFNLDDYIEYVMYFLHHLGPNTHVLAVCQPSVPVLAAVSLMAEDEDYCAPSSMTLMGGPIDTRVSPTEVNKLAEEKELEWFEQSVIAQVPVNYPGFMRHVYPGFMQLTGFMTMNMDKHVGAHLDLYNHMIEGDGDSAEDHRDFYDEYLSVMDLPAEFYLQTLKTVFMDHSLPMDDMNWRDRKVHPSAIKNTALFTIEGERDDITGRGQTEAAHTICTNIPEDKQKHILHPSVGHYGIFNGRRWREEIKPQVAEFVLKHDKELGPKK